MRRGPSLRASNPKNLSSRTNLAKPGADPDRPEALSSRVGPALGVASQLEALAIMLILPAWRCDIRDVGQALALRRAAETA